MKQFTLQGNIKDGKLNFSKKFYLFQLSKMGSGNVIITIEKERSIRSQQQNRYYWLCLEIIGEHCGYSVEDVHEIFKRLFLKKKLLWRGRELETCGSTTELSRGEFVSYMQKIQEEAIQLGIVLPSSDEYFGYGEMAGLEK